MDKKEEFVSVLQGLQSSHEESDVYSESEDFSSKVTEILNELTSKSRKEETKLDVTLLCEFMTPSESELLWEILLIYTNSLINTLTDEEENEEASKVEEEAEAEANNKIIIVAMLRKVSSVSSQYFELSTLTSRPNSFFLTIQSLHNILVPLDEDITGSHELKQSIARLCERAWNQDEMGCELLMTQLIPFLLLNVLDSCDTRDSDVKRLYAIRDAFALLDYEDKSIQTIQGLLLRCFTDPSFLKIPEGRRFLSFSFTLHIDLHNLIVGVMKPQLGTGNKSVSQAYGDILYRAWRDLNIAATATISPGTTSTPGGEAGGGNEVEVNAAILLRESLEDNLQDMAHNAIHARERKYFKSLRLVLNVFHENKNNKSVDSLLLKVYGPIMWRSLRCAHPLVRMQASIIFFDCFPLQSSDHTSNIRETESLLQKQFDLLHTLLKDVDHRVRGVAAYGVCKILRTFWEVIPTGTTTQILTYVVSTLGVDAACANVRANVINGMRELLENPLSHVVLQGLLPLLAHSVHDHSERVRAAFLRLLCSIKTTRGFKFYDIVSIDLLCDQLSADVHRPAICSLMTELLLNSFYPRASASGDSGNLVGAMPVKAGEYGVEQIKRCLQFSRSHPQAAVVFYSNLYLHTSVGSSTKMCVGLWNTLRDNLKKAPSSAVLAEERLQQGKEKQQKQKNKRGNKRQHPEQEGAGGAQLDFISTVSLCHQILPVITALLKSTLKMVLNNATYQLSRDMVITHISSEAMQTVLGHMLDFQKACGENEGESGEVAELVQGCISEILEVVAMVSTIRSTASDGPSSARSGKTKTKTTTKRGGADEDSSALFTSEGMLSLYFSSPHEGNGTVVDGSYAVSILDAAIAFHQARKESVDNPKKSLKKSAKAKASASSVADFALWSLVKDKFAAMSALLSPDDAEESEGDEKTLGKRKKRKSVSSNKRKPLENQEQVVGEFSLAVKLLCALLEGRSQAIVAFREETLRSEECYQKILSVFSVMRNILDRIVSRGSGVDSLEGGVWLELESSVTLCVRLWLCVLCQRDAQKEDNAGCSSEADDLTVASGQGNGDQLDLLSSLNPSSTSTELGSCLSWVTKTVLSAFHLSSMSAEDKTCGDSNSTRSKVPKRGVQGEEEKSLPPHSPVFLDNLLAACLSVLTDALLSGIASDVILPHINQWLTKISDVSSSHSTPPRLTANALARLAFAIYSGKVLHHHTYMDDKMGDISAARPYKESFDTCLEQLWEGCVECVLILVQKNDASGPCGVPAIDFTSESGEEDGEAEKVEANEPDDKADKAYTSCSTSIDLRILYCMLQLPSQCSKGSQQLTKIAQQKYSSALIKKIIRRVCCAATVKQETLERLLDRSSPRVSGVPGPVSADVSTDSTHLLTSSTSELLQWSNSSASLLDILLKKVNFSECVASFTLKHLRSMLLESVENLRSGGNSLLVAVLVKMVMVRSRPSSKEEASVGDRDRDGSVVMLLSAIDKLMEPEENVDRRDAPGEITPTEGDMLGDQETAEGKGPGGGKAGLTRKIVALLRM